MDRSPGAPPIPLLTAGALRGTRAATPLIVDHRSPGESATRLLARSIAAQGQRMVVVVGSSLEPVDTALGSLDNQLLLGGPVVLVLASLAASVLAGGALRPVEAMRRRAAAFSGNDLGQRLPNTAADDELGRLARTLNAMLDRVEQADTTSAASSPTPATSCAARHQQSDRQRSPPCAQRCHDRSISGRRRSRAARARRRPRVSRHVPAPSL